MKNNSWIKKYKESIELVENSTDVLTGFNANIDCVHKVSELDINLEGAEPKFKDTASSLSDLRSCLAYCIQEGENHEIKLDMDIDFEGEKFIGGQGGIMANYLAKTGNGIIFYTPFLSQELADKLEDKILYPVIEGEFRLKNVRDSSNTDRTKTNHIFEFDQEKSGRLIVSDNLKGFGPYFRKGIEDKLGVIQDNIDCALLSGFHNVEGNKEAKLKKAALQLAKIEVPLHLEYAHKDDETASNILKHIAPEVDSLGMDETEFKKMVRLLYDEELEEDVSLGEAFHHSKEIVEDLEVSRLHLHTYRYHITVTGKSYPRKPEKIRKSMLYGEISAIQKAETGVIPDLTDIEDFNMENKELNGLRELEHFEDFFNLDSFSETGIARLDEHQVVAIPTIIHQKPERTVGMGDIISSGAFVSEINGD